MSPSNCTAIPDLGNKPSLKDKLLQAWHICIHHPLVNRELIVEKDIYTLRVEKTRKVFIIQVFINENGYRIDVPTGAEGCYISKDEYEDCVRKFKGEEKELLGLKRLYELL